jgi:hypothetical protein
MKVNGIGKQDRSMEEVTRYGATEASMKDIGKMTRLTEEAG